MKRMKSWFLCWLVLSLLSQNIQMRFTDNGSDEGSNTGSDEGSNKSSNKGSVKGSNTGSDEGSNKGSDEGSNTGSDEGSNKGSVESSNKGSVEGSNKSSNTGSDEGSNKGSDEGSNKGSVEGSNTGSDEGSDEGSNTGSDEGSNNGSNKGSVEGSNKGSVEGSNKGSVEGSNKSSNTGSDKGSNKGSDEGSNTGSDEGSNKGSNTGSDESSNTGSDEGSNKGSNTGSDEGSNKGSVEGSNTSSDEGSNKGSVEGSNKGSVEGSNKSSNTGSDEGSNKGSDEGSNKGSNTGSDEGSNKGSNTGSDEGSNKGSNTGSDEGSNNGSNKGSVEGSNTSSDEGSNKGSVEGSNKGSVEGSNKSSNKGSVEGSNKSSVEGSNKGSVEGSNKGSVEGSNKSSNKVSVEGSNKGSNQGSLRRHECNTSKTIQRYPETVEGIMEHRHHSNPIEAIETLERLLEETEVNESISLSFNNSVAFLYKPKVPFNGLEIHASDKKVRSSNSVSDSDKVSVQLPRELDAGSENTIVFCMLTWPDANWTIREASAELHESRLVGLSVRGKNISGLQERVNITLAVSVNDTQKPSCVFLNVFTKDFSTDGCLTLWEPGQRNIICSCDHLTYFGVLVVSSASLSQNDLQILTYITLIGCSLSLFALIITVLLFIAKRKVRADISMKVHINLAIALILLNLHFLPSQTVAALSFPTLCFYMAVSLHYSLLATFSWMALEGLHLYLLLVRVFNIYIRKYLLKLSLVGWGLPAVIVALVVIIDSSWYGLVPLVSSNPNSTQICYIRNTTVKLVTTLGVFGLVFLFNAIMLGVTVRRVVSLHQSKKFGQSDSNRVKKDICTLLGVTALLGITWGLVFFSFGYLTTPGLYLFCILNSLQGFFIFLWFVMSLRKKGDPSTKSSVTRSTNT
ncbi:adhesion G-protein coupled receptor G5-like isoform X9 [Trematomus bernacchii]|uniref:adhesion G-protein coupled receptor G5-like isoform X9 n=1 Tax=Trematomus bernacchii TaxID=40690 RepID=UPI00146D2871|nr:adhesion G-protein coupled receptor G5-like isoform X9 [Trematomus bernacchii]